MKNQLSLIVLFVLIISACSKTSDKEYMNMASENVKKGNFSEALENYEKVLSEYPESKLAPDALVQEAALYHGNKIKNISQKESLKKASELFKSVSEKYPKSKQAPQSLFMAGFIYANELEDYAEAKKAYNLFLEKYPNHELAASAKSELDNLGLSPDEILKKKLSIEDK